MQSLRGNTLAVVVGALGGVYGSLGVVQAAQNAFNKVWAVPRSSRPNPVMARLLSLSMLVALGIGLVVSTALSALSAVASQIGGSELGIGLRALLALARLLSLSMLVALGIGLVVSTALSALSAVASQIGGSELGIGLRALLALAAVVLNVALLAFAFRLLTAQSAGTRRVLPGAVAAAVIWQLLQVLGTYYFGHTLRNSSATYGLFGVVLGLMVWLYLSAFAVVLGAEINSVRDRRLWPRSLLTPFTDDVQLTRGDRKAYASYAQTEQHKGFETVDVDFDQPAQDGSEQTTDESQPATDDGERTTDESRPAPDGSDR